MIKGMWHVLAMLLLWAVTSMGLLQAFWPLTSREAVEHDNWHYAVTGVVAALLVSVVCRGERRRGYSDGEMNVIRQDLAAAQ